MLIEHVCVNNYRAAKDCDFNGAPLVCIIGENNSGKSTLLTAISLFFSGTQLHASDFYDAANPITIEVIFSDIKEHDFNRVAREHVDRLKELIVDGKLYFVRVYNPKDGKSTLQCKRPLPNDTRYDPIKVKELVSGKKPAEISGCLAEAFPDKVDQTKGIKTQGGAVAWIEEEIAAIPLTEKSMKLTALPTGMDNSVKPLFPIPVFIAAVKDFKDDVKAKESTSFGKLLSILTGFLEKSGEMKAIVDSFAKLHSMLNKTTNEDGSVSDKRIQQLQEVENRLTEVLQENFPDVKIGIEIPKPELKQVMSNALIRIDDGVEGLIDSKGDGLKRAVTFAILRTYVDMQRQSVRDADADSNENLVPYLFLFEEPELYLHPNAQRILFEALEKLSDLGSQVILTTHSPAFFSADSTGSFVKARKTKNENARPFTELVKIYPKANQGYKDAFQIICYENNAAAFFSDSVLLVEGDTDYIYLRGLSKLISPAWDFDRVNMPVIRTDGKHNVKRYRDFFSAFGIKIYVLVDADSIFEGFDKLGADAHSHELQKELIIAVDKIGQHNTTSSGFNSSDVKMLTNRATWKENYEQLKVLARRVASGETLTEQEIKQIDNLFPDEKNSDRVKTFINPALNIVEKQNLLQHLRTQNIFVLGHGAMERYYPAGASGADKPSKALKAIQLMIDDAALIGQLPRCSVMGPEQCELTQIFTQVFSSN